VRKNSKSYSHSSNLNNSRYERVIIRCSLLALGKLRILFLQQLGARVRGWMADLILYHFNINRMAQIRSLKMFCKRPSCQNATSPLLSGSRQHTLRPIMYARMYVFIHENTTHVVWLLVNM
jgi:hypothetical protein